MGDIVGYGANPNEVVELVRQREAVAVMGNHDYAAVSGETGGFNASAAMGARWTRDRLTPDSARFLGSLASQRDIDIEGAPFHLVHGSPDDPLWEYVDPSTHSQLFSHYLARLHSKALALGHTHVPFVWSGPEGTVFNPGSVGQPRDGDWRASYAVAVIENGAVTVELCRTEYDWRSAANKIMEAGLPARFADRLRTGN